MTTTVEIMGGLGNQLFQVCALIAYSIRTKTPFFFENKPITCGDRKKYYWDTPLLNRLKGFIRSPLHPKQQVLYKEPFFHYTPIPQVNKVNNIKLVGYFQSAKYFQDYKDVIFRMLKLKETQQYIKEKISPYLPTTEFSNIVSLHFRVGDYAHQPHNHPLMPIDYYEKALEKLLNDDPTGKKDWFILYFCEENDIKYVNEKINFLKQKANFQEMTFIKVPPHLEDWEQMMTMSLCKHHIIANSSFSWWGAWLNENENKVVIAPKIWFRNEEVQKQTLDLIPEKWVRI